MKGEFDEDAVAKVYHSELLDEATTVMTVMVLEHFLLMHIIGLF